MKVIAIFLCVITTASCYSTYLNLLIEEWETYKLKFNKVYESKMEEALRMNIYAKSKLKVAEHNQKYYEGEESHLIETNRFSDMLPHEWGQYKGLIMSTPESNSEGATFIGPHDDVILPAFVDWRKEGAVTPVKNQGMCGSCWAFSATGCLEGQHFRKTKQLVSLSEQNLVDCVVDSDGIKDTCKRGGMMNDAYMYIKKNSGIDTEASYPYKATDGVCHFSNNTIGATDKGFVSIPEFDEEALKKAVATVGPISVAIDASMGSFRFYKEGVYYDKHCSQMHLDHGVLAVGYGTTEKGEDYWLVKNSWDDDWGMKGYIMMSRNKDNNCGIATMASYPLV